MIHEINRFFNIGWQLFGHGPVLSGIQWSDGRANTIFSFAARDDFRAATTTESMTKKWTERWASIAYHG